MKKNKFVISVLELERLLDFAKELGDSTIQVEFNPTGIGTVILAEQIVIGQKSYTVRDVSDYDNW